MFHAQFTDLCTYCHAQLHDSSYKEVANHISHFAMPYSSNSHHLYTPYVQRHGAHVIFAFQPPLTLAGGYVSDK